MKQLKIMEDWNNAISQQEKRETVSRDHIWASELTKSNFELYLRLKGTKPTNPANSRSIRKFFAGDFAEQMVAIALRVLGAKITTQTRCEDTIAGIKISGKADFIYEGRDPVSLEEKMKAIRSKLEGSELEYFNELTDIYDNYKIKDLTTRLNLPECSRTGLELKSMGLYPFSRVEAVGAPLDSQALQTYFYARTMNLPFTLECMSRDDLRFEEFEILKGDKVLEAKLLKKLHGLKSALSQDTPPGKEPLILFDEEMGKFSKNINVEYSDYLSMFYGRPETPEDEKEAKRTEVNQISFLAPEDYRTYIEPKVKALNSMIKAAQKENVYTKTQLKEIEKGFEPELSKTQINTEQKISEGEKIQKEFGFNFSREQLKAMKQTEEPEQN